MSASAAWEVAGTKMARSSATWCIVVSFVCITIFSLSSTGQTVGKPSKPMVIRHLHSGKFLSFSAADGLFRAAGNETRPAKFRMVYLSPELVISLRQQLDAGAAVTKSPTAQAVEHAKDYLDLLLKHQPDDLEAVSAARQALDEAKLANGPQHSDCYQSAEAAFKTADDAVVALHVEIAEAVEGHSTK